MKATRLSLLRAHAGHLRVNALASPSSSFAVCGGMLAAAM
jgi:hypothetical protein